MDYLKIRLENVDTCSVRGRLALQLVPLLVAEEERVVLGVAGQAAGRVARLLAVVPGAELGPARGRRPRGRGERVEGGEHLLAPGRLHGDRSVHCGPGAQDPEAAAQPARGREGGGEVPAALRSRSERGKWEGRRGASEESVKREWSA